MTAVWSTCFAWGKSPDSRQAAGDLRTTVLPGVIGAPTFEELV